MQHPDNFCCSGMKKSFLCIQVLESFSLVDFLLIRSLTLSSFDLECLFINLCCTHLFIFNCIYENHFPLASLTIYSLLNHHYLVTMAVKQGLFSIVPSAAQLQASFIDSALTFLSGKAALLQEQQCASLYSRYLSSFAKM